MGCRAGKENERAKKDEERGVRTGEGEMMARERHDGREGGWQKKLGVRDGKTERGCRKEEEIQG